MKTEPLTVYWRIKNSRFCEKCGVRLAWKGKRTENTPTFCGKCLRSKKISEAMTEYNRKKRELKQVAERLGATIYNASNTL